MAPKGGKKPAALAKRDDDATKAAAWMKVATGLAKIADRMGMAFVILLLLFFAVWKFGNDQTQNDFIRGLLFGGPTGTWYVRSFFALLIVDATFGAAAIR